MIRKIIIWIMVFCLAMVAGAYMAKTQVQAPSIIGAVLSPKLILPDNNLDKILEEINTKRKESKLSELKLSDKLIKAAKARLSVIVMFDDYIGSSSALTREKSLDLVSYSSTVVGDVFFTVQDQNEKIVDKLLAEKTERETVMLPKFTEVGMAEFKTDNKYFYYFIFGNEQKKVSTVTVPKVSPTQNVSWGGPDLWNAVNKRRVEMGVGQLSKKDELCTIASIRLNQLLELKKLDGHAGFQPVLDRSDLKWIGEKYNISEYLAQGFETPTETVKGWENTLGHRSLLTGGEYVWGCIYAQNTFAVAITAY